VAEDDPIVRMATGVFLSTTYPGCVVFETGNGADALKACLAQSPSLLITNHHMVGINGLDLVRAVRSQGMSAPILMLTGDPLVADQALGEGANLVLRKPYTFEELGAAVAQLLSPPNARVVAGGPNP